MAKNPSPQDAGPCWCGSGKQYKICHRNRDKQIPIAPHKIVPEFRKAFSKKYCLHPQNSLGVCSTTIGRAHSVSASTALNCVAEEGHVLHFGIPSKDFLKSSGRFTVQPIGVNEASIFTGVCHLHDTQTFRLIDQPIQTLTGEHYFLLAYRSLSREIFTKAAAIASNEAARNLDKGKDRAAQIAIQKFCQERELGLQAGIQDLHKHKAEFDECLLRRDFDKISHYTLELNHAPQMVCSIGFTPEIDFHGNQLQSLDDLETHVDLCTCSIIPTRRGGAIVFAWLNEPNGACSRLINSLEKLKPYLVPSAVVRLVFEHGENVFFSRSWWNSLDSDTQKILEVRANSFYDKPAGTLLDDGFRPVLWSVVAKTRSGSK